MTTQNLNIIDEQENIIGETSRKEIHEKGLLHREVHVWLYTPNGQIVFQKRSATKDTYPNLLDASVGGHIEVGQTPEQAALAELEEETGIKATASDIKFIKKEHTKSFDQQTKMTNNVIRHIYAYNIGSESIDLMVEKGEAEGFVTYSLDQLENLSEEDKKLFISKMLKPEQMELYREILK